MKQLIGLIHLGALTVFSVALYSARRRTQTSHNDHSTKPDCQARSEGELVLLGMDGTVIAREINLGPHAQLNLQGSSGS